MYGTTIFATTRITFALVLNGTFAGDFFGDILGSGVSGTKFSLFTFAASLLDRDSTKQEDKKKSDFDF